MNNFRISVKSFIVNKNNELLLIKRRNNDVQCLGEWDFPGGRLELGEDPFKGLKRETKEETGLDIEIKEPLNVRNFTREDGQKITQIVFLCKAILSPVALSEEHTEYNWLSLDKAYTKILPVFREEINIFKKKS